jgi:hypothetical protein
MLNSLKNAIRKKRLYFIVKSTRENIVQLYSLLIDNVIVGFSKRLQRKQTFLVVFINYCHNLDSSILGISTDSKKTSLLQNKNLSAKFLSSNFIINMDIKNKVSVNKNRLSSKDRAYAKFR